MIDKYRYVFKKGEEFEFAILTLNAIESGEAVSELLRLRNEGFKLVARDPFIGLFDTDGQEIYHRDLVGVFDKEFASPVLYHEGSFGYYCGAMHHPFCSHNKSLRWGNNHSEGDVWKVGNVYQNRDLVAEWKSKNPKWMKTYGELKEGLW